MEQQISQGYLSAFIFVFYPGGGHYKNIQHVKGRRRQALQQSDFCFFAKKSCRVDFCILPAQQVEFLIEKKRSFLHQATFQFRCYNVKENRNLIFAHENMKKQPSKVAHNSQPISSTGLAAQKDHFGQKQDFNAGSPCLLSTIYLVEAKNAYLAKLAKSASINCRYTAHNGLKSISEFVLFYTQLIS